MRLAFRFIFTTSLLALAGCGIVGEERALYMKRDWDNLTSTRWLNVGSDVTGFSEAFPSAQRKEQLAEQEICLHNNSRNRVITQNGVNDSVAYRRCSLAPYAQDGGSRMNIRPDGQGRVIR